jgi:hypothetical protein
MRTSSAPPRGPLTLPAIRARWLTQTWHVIARGKAGARRADLVAQAGAHLAALQLDLATLGLRSTLTTDTVWPWLRVHTRPETIPRIADFENSVVAVYVGSRWGYYWPWLELIGAAGDPAAAAAVIADHLGHQPTARAEVAAGERAVPAAGA